MIGPVYKKEYFDKYVIISGVALFLISIANVYCSPQADNPISLFFFPVIQVAFVLVTYLNIRNGYSSSNIGTYYRSQKPIRFWISTSLPAIIASGMQIVIWI